MISAIVKSVFTNTIKEKLSAKPEVMRFVLSHERMPLVIDNLSRELMLLVLKRPTTSLEVISKITADVSIQFASAALSHKEESLLSEGERIRRVTKAGEIDQMKEHITELEREATSTTVTSYAVRSKES